MSRQRVPRIDVAKLNSDEPSQRRPAVDQLGDSLSRFGIARLLLEETAASSLRRLAPRLAERVLRSLEIYFGLLSGRFPDSLTAVPPTGGRAGWGQRGIAQIVCGAGEDDPLGDGHSFRLANGEVATWQQRPDECLWFSGPMLSAWTAGVLPAMDVLEQGGLETTLLLTEEGASADTRSAPLIEFAAERSRPGRG